MLRVSSYLIATQLSEGHDLIMHGITGAVDKVSHELGSSLLGFRGKDFDPLSLNYHIPEPTLYKLKDRGYVTNLSHEEEKSLLLHTAVTIHHRDISGSLPPFVIVPSYICNLRCPYCFQSHDMHAGKAEFSKLMTIEQVDRIFQIIKDVSFRGSIAKMLGLVEGEIKSEDLHVGNSITLFGGEPLTNSNYPIVEYIVKKARESSMTINAITNGVELDKFSELISPTSINTLQITLDGFKDTHDLRRIGPGFRNTFDKIVSNIEMALSKNVYVSVRINVDNTNLHSLKQLKEYIDSKGWTDNPRFGINAAVVTGEAVANKEKLISRLELVRSVSKIDAAHKKIIETYESTANDILKSCLFGDGYPFKTLSFCGAETGMLIFDPLNDVYTCWEHIGCTPNRIGTYDENGLDLRKEEAIKWLTRFPGSIEECSECPYALIHKSGCANHALSNSETIFAPACESFQEYFPFTLAEAYRQVEAEILGTLPGNSKG